MTTTFTASLKKGITFGFDKGGKLLDFAVLVGIVLSLVAAHCEYIASQLDVYLNGNVAEISSVRVVMLILKQHCLKRR